MDKWDEREKENTEKVRSALGHGAIGAEAVGAAKEVNGVISVEKENGAKVKEKVEEAKKIKEDSPEVKEKEKVKVKVEAEAEEEAKRVIKEPDVDKIEIKSV